MTMSRKTASSVPPRSRRGLAALMVASLLIARASLGESDRFDQAPEFPSQDPQQWIGEPQTLKGLSGKVVILDVWTFG